MIFRIISIIILFVSCGDYSSKAQINIAVASSMQPVLQEIATQFENDYHIKINLISASSGKLSSQIEAGAPYDLFLSADSFFTNYLFDKLLLPTPPQTFAFGKLSLVSRLPFNLDETNEVSEQCVQLKKWLLSLSNHKIAVPNPKVAPYGKAAIALLNNLNLETSLNSKLVYTESVSQSNQFIWSKAVEVAFTSGSAETSFTDNSEALYFYNLPDSLYPPIENSYVIISNNNLKLTEQFVSFLLSKQVKKILEQYAYVSI